MSLKLDNLSARTGDRTLFEGLSAEIRPGQVWAVLGENGAGKSTLLRIMAGLGKAALGSVLLDERDVLRWPARERARQIAWMAQHDDDGFSATVMDCLVAARYPYADLLSRDSGADEARAQALLGSVDLAGFADRTLWSLSGGERRRVALAAALMQATPYRLLDEPLAALDPRNQSTMIRLISSTARADGATVFTTHDPNHALAIATHVLAIDGEATTHGPAQTMLDPRLLSALYRCEVSLVEQGAQRAFIVGQAHLVT
ncbi:ABC transporter ATP-binding protein [soil metagenome]